MQAQRCVASRQATFSGRTFSVRPQRYSRSVSAVKVGMRAVHTHAIVCLSRYSSRSHRRSHIIVLIDCCINILLQAMKVGENLKDSAEYYRCGT